MKCIFAKCILLQCSDNLTVQFNFPLGGCTQFYSGQANTIINNEYGKARMCSINVLSAYTMKHTGTVYGVLMLQGIALTTYVCIYVCECVGLCVTLQLCTSVCVYRISMYAMHICMYQVRMYMYVCRYMYLLNLINASQRQWNIPM